MAASPSSTSAPGFGGCPLKGCSEGVGRVAKVIVGALDEVTIASQRLQAAAQWLGGRGDGFDEEVVEGGFLEKRFNPVHGTSSSSFYPHE